MEHNRNLRWWRKMRNAFGNRRFIRLTSSTQVEPLLNDYLQSTHDSEFDRDYNDGFNDLCKRNFDLERKIDELALKVNSIKSREIKFERDRVDFEALFKRNSDLERKVDELTRKVIELESNQNKKDEENKDETQRIEKQNATLKSEVGKMKDKIAALDFLLADKMHAMSPKTSSPKTPFDAVIDASFGFSEIEETEKSISPNEIAIGAIMVIFLIGFFIGMQIR